MLVNVTIECNQSLATPRREAKIHASMYLGLSQHVKGEFWTFVPPYVGSIQIV